VKRRKQQEISSTKNKTIGRRGGPSQHLLEKGAVPSGKPDKIQSKGNYKKRKRIVDEKPNKGNKMIKIDRKRDDSNRSFRHASAAVSYKSRKSWKKSGNQGPE